MMLTGIEGKQVKHCENVEYRLSDDFGFQGVISMLYLPNLVVFVFRTQQPCGLIPLHT